MDTFLTRKLLFIRKSDTNHVRNDSFCQRFEPPNPSHLSFTSLFPPVPKALCSCLIKLCTTEIYWFIEFSVTVIAGSFCIKHRRSRLSCNEVSLLNHVNFPRVLSLHCCRLLLLLLLLLLKFIN